MTVEPSLAQRVCGSGALVRRQRASRAVMTALGQVQVDGLARIPATGPVVLAINHVSMFDGPLVFGFVPRPVSCLVKVEAFKPVLGAVWTSAGQIAVRRDQIDPGPVRLCVQILRASGVVGIYPEGRRGDGRVMSAKPGVGYLALRTGATVVPVACHGTGDLVRQWRRSPVRMVVGEPIRFDRHPDRVPLNRRQWTAAAALIRIALADLVERSRPDASAIHGRLVT